MADVRVTTQASEVLGSVSSDVRVTTQATEVLGSVSSDIRVTMQYIEYLRKYNDGFIDDTINLTDSPIVGNMIRNRSVTHGIFFGEFIDAAGVPLSRRVTSDFTIDALEYDPETRLYVVLHDGLYDVIAQEVIRNRNQDNKLYVADEIVYVFIKNTAVAESVTSVITFGQDVSGAKGIAAAITFGQTITQEVGRGIFDDITITDSIGAIRRSNITVTDSLSLGDTASYTKNENAREVLCTYTPFVGVTSNPDAPTPPPTSSPTLIPLNQITLTCEAAGTSITLRNPELGDKDISQFQRISRETRGGTLVVFSDPIWPRTQKIILEFTGLTEEKGQEFLTFLNLSLGQLVDLIDWDSRKVWGGILTAPQSPIVRDGPCKVFATVEFEGIPQTVILTNTDTLPVTDVVFSNFVLSRTITDTLAVTDVVSSSFVVSRTIADTLAVTDVIATTIDTLWSDAAATKLILQSGQFTSTVLKSQIVTGGVSSPNAIGWDGTNTPWVGAADDKLYLQAGQFTSTVITSLYIGGKETNIAGIAWDSADTPWCGSSSDKMYLQSGQFTSTVKDSLNVSGIDSHITGMSWDGTNYPWSGNIADKLYLQSGPFTSTLVDSQYIGGISSVPTDVTWNGSNTPWTDVINKKLYMQGGQFTSTLLDSHALGGSTTPTGICPTNFPDNA